MAFEVLLTAGAEQDLEDIYDYIAESDSYAKADYSKPHWKGAGLFSTRHPAE